MDYRSIIESKYNREKWQILLYDIFKKGANFLATPISVDAKSDLAVSSVQLGTITLTDGNKIAVYEIKLSKTVDILVNRVGIRNLLASDWKMKGCVGAFMLCFRDNESVLRFSYVSQTMGFDEDGKLIKKETDTKRFTYYLGEGHRSRTAIKQFEELKNSKLGLADITKAFSIEALSDKFFKDYKDIYEDIVEYATGKRMIKVSNKWEERVIKVPNASIMNGFRCFSNPEKAVRDYVKNLMGRIVFLQFIQKKGWLGVPVGKEWGEGDKEFLQNLYDRCDKKDNFIDGILEVLFDDINTKRINDAANTVLGYDIMVPYLNGGLFELSKADECSFRLPKKLMDAIITFFGSYNFTIDENDPDDAEIGIDPEMLGRIFENLLEDNKDKGAFYTPKEIVQYMCKESLIAYLQTDKDDSDKEAIRQFVTTYKANVLSSSLLTDVDQKLKDVKICDPAIGSGAFPMGLLKELFACRSAIEDLSGENAADIKKHIIQNNIYGVDIEKGAVDIARLRFWLSIIVDELTPHALPNMDFKIMQGNSLIPTFNGKYVNLNDKLRHVNSSKIRDAKKELFRLQSIFYYAEGDQKKELLVKIKYQILEIVKLQMDYEYKAEIERSSKTMDLFNPNVRQTEIDDEKNRIIGICIKLQNDLNSSKSLAERAELQIPFFDWKIMFPDVFNTVVDDGFDIVIGNPPYIKEYENRDAFSEIKGRQYYKAKMDIWFYFLCVGMDLLDKKGKLCFIAQPQWRTSDGALIMRNKICEEGVILKLVDFGTYMVFEASTQAMILLLNKSTENDSYSFEYKLNDGIINNKLELDSFLSAKFKTYNFVRTQYYGNNFTFSDSPVESSIIDKIISKSNFTIDGKKEIIQGIIGSPDDAFKLTRSECANYNERELNLIKPFATSTVAYYTPLGEESIIYIYDGNTPTFTSKTHPHIWNKLLPYADKLNNRREVLNGRKSWYSLWWERDESFFVKGPKIIFAARTVGQNFTYTEDPFYASRNCFYIKTDRINLRYLVGLLNSDTMHYYMHKKLKKNGDLLQLDKVQFLTVPLLKPKDDFINEVANKVQSIIENLKANEKADISSYVNDINNIVYQLFELNEVEINAIKNANLPHN